MNSTTQAAALARGRDRLPAPIVEALDRLARRRRLILLVRGGLAVAAVAVAALLAAMAFDAAVTVVSTWARWAVTAAVAAAATGAAIFFIVRPLLRRADHTHVARVIEQHHPEIEERISSAVELLSSSDGEHSADSKALIEQLTREAVEHIRYVEPAREFNFRAARPWLVAAAVALVVFMGVWIGYPSAAPRLALRAVAPFANVGSVAASQMTLTPGDDSVVLAGSDLRIEASFNGEIASRVVVLREMPGGGETRIEMSPVIDAYPLTTRFAAVLPVGAEGFRYRVVADDHLVSRYFTVVSTPRPAVDALAATLHYPAYVSRADETVERMGGKLIVPHGTRVELTATFNKPLASARLAGDGAGEAPGSAQLGATPATAKWSIVATPERAGSLRIETTDAHGFSGEARRFDLSVESDAAPRVRWVSPSQSQLAVSRADSLAIGFEAEEDHGFSSAAMLVQPEGGAVQRIRMELPSRLDPMGTRWSGRDRLEVSRIDPSGAPRLSVRIELTDTRPSELGGGQVALSDPITLTLDNRAPSALSQELRARSKAIEDRLRSAMGELAAARDQMARQVIPQVSAEPVKLSPQATTWIGEVRARSVAAERLVAGVIERGGDARALFPELSDELGVVLRSHIEPARAAIDSITLGDTKDEQKGDAQLGHDRLESARAAIEKLLAKLPAEVDRVVQQRQLADRTRQLADDQDRLRRIAERITEPNEREGLRRQIVDRILDDQREVAAKAEQLATGLDAAGWNGGGEHREAASSTQSAAAQMQAGELGPAQTTAKQAAGQLGALGQKLTVGAPPAPPTTVPNDPSSSWPGKAEGLARRQEHIADQLEAVGKGELDKAIASMQRDVAERTAALAATAAAVAQAQAQAAAQQQTGAQSPQQQPPSSPLNPGPAPDPNNTSGPQAPSQPPTDAQLAADQLAAAAELADRAAVELGKPDPRGRYLPPKVAEGEQAPSENPGASPDGGRGTKGGGSNTGAGSSNKPSPPNANQNNTQGGGKNPPRPPGKQNYANNVSRSQSQGSPFAAQNASANAMKDAASTLEGNRPPNISAFKGFGSTPGIAMGQEAPPMPAGMQGQGQQGQQQGKGQQPGKPGGEAQTGRGAKLGVGGELIESGANPFGIPADDWLRLPPDLRTQMMTAGDDRAPLEYREVVRRYFRDLARLGSLESEGL